MRKGIIAVFAITFVAVVPIRAESVAQRAVLLEEDATNPQGIRYEGTVTWRSETARPGNAATAKAVISANIEIPGRQMTANWSLRRNADERLHASHTIEIKFNLPAGFSDEGIDIVPGVLMKETEGSKAAPLKGTAMRVSTNSFMIGLSAAEIDLKNNVALHEQRDWIDMPLVYADGHRAILMLQKGLSGERVFNDAFAAWQNSGSGNTVAQ